MSSQAEQAIWLIEHKETTELLGNRLESHVSIEKDSVLHMLYIG